MMARSWIVACCLITGLVGVLLGPQVASGNAYLPNEVIVRFKPGATVACRDSSVALVNATVVDSIPDNAGYVIQLADTSVLAAVSTLQGRFCVDYAEPNYKGGEVLFDAPDDSLFGQQWHLNNTGQGGGLAGADIDALTGWGYVNTSPDVIVAVMDKGIAITRPDLVNNIYTNTAEVSGTTLQDLDGNGYKHDVHGWDFFNNDYTPEDDAPGTSPHGTAVASILGAEGDNGMVIAGVTWGVQMLPVKIIQGNALVAVDSLASAFHYAVNNGAKIINCSWRTGYSTTLSNAIDYARSHGVLVVAGAGNDGLNNDQVAYIFPARFAQDNILACAFTDRYDSLNTFTHSCGGGSTAYSNYGPTTVDIAAPGCDFCADYPDYPSCNHSGTSVSAPVVSGAAALLWQQHPTWTYTQIKDRLMATVDTLLSTKFTVLSKGRLNIGRALDNVPPSPVTFTYQRGRHSVKFMWTDTGDDGTTGTPTVADLRMSTTGFVNTDSAFAAATPIPQGPPGEAGTEHCIVFDSQQGPGTHTYYIGMKMEDGEFNWSTIGSSSASTLSSGFFEVEECPVGNRPAEAIAHVRPTDGASFEWALESARPNPMSGQASISYSVKSAGKVTIGVYDVAGRLIKTLVNGIEPAGVRTIVWNGTGSDGSHVRSGVYFYRMLADGYRSDRRLVVVGE
jgi:subtilisin family serine protease